MSNAIAWAVAYKRAMEPVVKAEAKERQGRPGKARSAKTAEHKKGESRDIVAAQTGKGRTTVSQAEKVAAAAEADPSLPASKQGQPGREGGRGSESER